MNGLCSIVNVTRIDAFWRDALTRFIYTFLSSSREFKNKSSLILIAVSLTLPKARLDSIPNEEVPQRIDALFSRRKIPIFGSRETV